MDLGIFQKPLLIFGGPYSNLDALIALQEQAERMGIPPNRIICTGDVVAYCGQPYETIEAIRDWGIHVLMGNCEESFAENSEDCGCGFSEGTSCDLLSAKWFTFSNKKITPEQRQWFAQRPRVLTFTFNGFNIQIVHGSVTTINQFLFASDSIEDFQHQLSASNADIIIAGHSGIPFSKKVGNKLWHNSGAIGMPANDGTPRTWFSLFSIKNGGIKIETQPLLYNHNKAATTMINNGLKNGYSEALLSGYWPSMDVLPDTEKNNRGKKIEPETIYF